MQKQKMTGNRIKSILPLYLLLLPGLIIMMVYSYGPMAHIIIAFQKYSPARGIMGSEWIGFENFRYIFTQRDFTILLRNSFKIAILKIIADIVCAVTITLLLSEVRRLWFKRIVQTLIYFPHFLSWVILAGIIRNLLGLDGIINNMLASFGIEAIHFLGSKTAFVPVLVITDVWQNVGFSTIVYLAAVSGINPELYEAAAIDGAGYCRRVWHITLPGIRSTIVLLSTLSIGYILSAGFEQIYMLYSPVVYEVADVFETWVYRMGLVNLQYSVATAMGLFTGIVSFVLMVTAYYLADRLAEYKIF
jgi:putative aldouronate transport system permease protein